MISVILPVRNSIKTIEQSLLALLESPYIKEILVADGGSTDGTANCVKEFRDPRVKLVSTEDTGIYNGANKALTECSGKYIMFMNSNDFLNPIYIRKALLADPKGEADFFYGCISFDGQIIKPRLDNSSYSTKVWQILPFPHVSLIVKKSVSDNLGIYDESFKIASDLDYMNRLLVSGARGIFINEIAAHCTPGGISSGFKHILEGRRVAIKNGRPFWSATFFAWAIYFYRLLLR